MSSDETKQPNEGEPAAQPPGVSPEADNEAVGDAPTADQPEEQAAAPAAGQDPPAAQDGDGDGAQEAQSIAALQEEAARNYDRLLRTAADFENYKRRARRDVREATTQAEDKVVRSFLPVIDNLERALAHFEGGPAEAPETVHSLVEGVKMVHKQFLNTLEQFGIQPFDAIGQVFDPELHEAIQQVPSEYPRNVVVHELQRGYRRDGRLVRPAMVVVSLGTPAGQHEQPAAAIDDEVEQEVGDAGALGDAGSSGPAAGDEQPAAGAQPSGRGES